MAALAEGNGTEPSPKRRKLSGGEIDRSAQNAFKEFKLNRILRHDPRNKFITLLGKFADDEENKDAVVLLDRLPFDPAQVSEMLTSEGGRSEETLKNNIYSTHFVYTPRTVADCKVTMIFPATSKHIDKYSDHSLFVVRETPHLYQTVTQPCISASQFTYEWVYNILEKKCEAERIVFEDPDPETGFILLPDMKWNRTDLNALYLVAIVHRRDLGSLRDLRGEHLPLLKNILDKGKRAIQEQFGISPHLLRIFFHYQPSYYHLHVHFTHLRFEAPGTDCLRAHVMEDVIDDLEMDGDYYAKKTLVYNVRENGALHSAFMSAGYFDN